MVTVRALDVTKAPFSCDPAGAVASGAALQAAINAVGVTARVDPAVLKIPAGTYKMDRPITLPAGASSRGWAITGDTKVKSTLRFPVSSVPDGEWAIRTADAAESVSNFITIENVDIQGPADALTDGYGVARTQIRGIRLASRMQLVNSRVRRFYANVGLYGNHITLRQSDLGGGYYGLYVLDSPSDGDIHIDNCDFTGNALASVGIADKGQLLGTHFFKGHLGFSPFAFYIEPQSEASYLTMSGVGFIGTSFEALGNGLIWDASYESFGALRAYLKSIHFARVAFSRRAAYSSAWHPSGHGIAAKRVDDFAAVNANFNLGDTGAALNDLFFADQITGLDWTQGVEDLDALAAFSSKSFLRSAAASMIVQGARYRGHAGQGYWALAQSSPGFPSAGQVVRPWTFSATSSSDGVAPYVGVGPLAGVAINAGSADTPVRVATSGRRVAVQASGAIAKNAIVVANSSGQAETQGAGDSRPVLGVAESAASSGLVTVSLALPSR